MIWTAQWAFFLQKECLKRHAMKEGEKMNDLLKINFDTEQPTVSARDLHEALGIRERFSLWFSRYADVFENGADYQEVGKPTVVNNGAKRVVTSL